MLKVTGIQRILAATLAPIFVLASCLAGHDRVDTSKQRLTPEELAGGVQSLRDAAFPQISGATITQDGSDYLYSVILTDDDLQTSEIWSVRFHRINNTSGTATVRDSTGATQLVVYNTDAVVRFSDGAGDVLAEVTDQVAFAGDAEARLQLALDVGATRAGAAAFTVYGAGAQELDRVPHTSTPGGDSRIAVETVILIIACVTLAIVIVGMVQNEITTASQAACIASLGAQQAAPARQVGSANCWVCVWDPLVVAHTATMTTCNIGVPPNPAAGQLLGVSGVTNVNYTYRVWYKLWIGTTTRTCGTVTDYAPLTNAWTTQAEANMHCNAMPAPGPQQQQQQQAMP